ncbi:Hypothetical predicted protein [Paramuricea clavata]|uniref:Uncharacterized protein n=1 Tax=Paramuricea clavata TaxID=317549 RepID=A0A6S7G052_PARCT|nr:Hypothetical predicted protein [Paramuricea clavata]
MAAETAHVQGPETVNINDLQNALQTLNIAFHEQDAEFHNALANELGVHEGLPNNQDEKVKILCHKLKKKAVKNIECPLLEIKHFASPLGMDVTEYSRQKVQELFENQYKYRWIPIPNEVAPAPAAAAVAVAPAAVAPAAAAAPAVVAPIAAAPAAFHFYRFCKLRDTYRTYNIRKAHVITRLWRAQKELQKIRNLTYQELCPPIYARSMRGNSWAQWTFDGHNGWRRRNGPNININWITNEVLRKYIHGNSKKKNFNNLPTGDKQLYWAVVEEDDHAEDGNNLPFRTQVYVGRAANGIQERWTGSQQSSHCMKMKFASDVMCPMVNYNPTALRPLQLVDLRLLLHKARHQNGENTSGLFIMGEYSKCKNMNKAETRHINGKIPDAPMILENWKPKDMNYGMNYDHLI